jgi:hypothetical protein
MHTTANHGLPHGSPHEPTTLDVRAVITTTLGLAALVAFGFAAMWILLGALAPGGVNRDGDRAQQEDLTTRRMPKLNPNQRTQRTIVEERQVERLRVYSRPSEDGFARIPIERAMELTVERYGSQGEIEP